MVDADFGSQSSALFGEVGRRFLNDHFGLTLGVRYYEDKVFNRKNFTTPPPYNVENEYDKTSPRVVLSWYPSENLTAYTSYSEGFRSAVPVPYNIFEVEPTFPQAGPDTIHNYEVGVKGGALDGAFRYEAAGYYIDWENVQQVILVPFGPTFVSGLINGESASGPGIDLGVTWRVTDNFSMAATYSWNDLTFDADVVSGGSVLFPEGSRLIMSPETTASLTGKYEWSFAGGYEAWLTASANYVSKQLQSADVPFGDDVVTSRASLSISTPNAHLTGTLFIDNANNFDGAIYHTLAGDPASVARARPRTFGLQLEYRY